MISQSEKNHSTVRYGTASVDGINIFFRESGTPKEKAIVLLHGFPTSSHMYREVLASLGDTYYLIAPDYPGFGNSDFPAPGEYEYTFDNLATTIERFLDQKGITEFVLGMQDYGAPIGYRLATKHPQRVKGLIIMNGNAYEEGFDPVSSAPVREFWQQRTPDKEAAISSQLMSYEGIKWMYTEGTRNPNEINPDNWVLDFAHIDRPGQEEAQLDLFYDYQNNVKLYPTWQSYLRKYQPPTLIAWGANDPIFITAGAEAYRRDLKEIDFHLYDTGHFVLEEEVPQIIGEIRRFMKRNE